MEFNFFARSVYSSLIFFSLLFHKISLSDGFTLRKLLCFTFAALVINKFLNIRNNRLFYYFFRVILKERKLSFLLFPHLSFKGAKAGFSSKGKSY